MFGTARRNRNCRPFVTEDEDLVPRSFSVERLKRGVRPLNTEGRRFVTKRICVTCHGTNLRSAASCRHENPYREIIARGVLNSNPRRALKNRPVTTSPVESKTASTDILAMVANPNLKPTRTFESLVD